MCGLRMYGLRMYGLRMYLTACSSVDRYPAQGWVPMPTKGTARSGSALARPGSAVRANALDSVSYKNIDHLLLTVAGVRNIFRSDSVRTTFGDVVRLRVNCGGVLL